MSTQPPLDMDTVLANLEQYCAEHAGPESVIELEQRLLDILDGHQSQQHHMSRGMSKRLPRWSARNEDMVPKDHYIQLQCHADNMRRELARMEKYINEARNNMVRQCQHEWQYDEWNRDHKSSYTCKHCGVDKRYRYLCH